MAPLAGFKPTTPWFVAKCSIQLSYSGMGGPMGNDPILTLSQSAVLNLYTMVTIDLAPPEGFEPP